MGDALFTYGTLQIPEVMEAVTGQGSPGRKRKRRVMPNSVVKVVSTRE